MFGEPWATTAEDARAAVEHAGRLRGGQPTMAFTVWEPFIEVLTRTPYAAGMTLGTVGNETSTTTPDC
jgi:hypothetical protein